MYISSLHYNTEGRGKVAVCIYHHFIIRRKDEEKLRYVYIITSLQTGRMKKTFDIYISSPYFNTKGRAKLAVFIYHHFIITSKDKQKFWYVYNIALL